MAITKISATCRYSLDDGTRCLNDPEGNSPFCRQHRGWDWFAAELEAYRSVCEHFRQDLREYWTKSSFFLLVQGGLVSVFVSLASRTDTDSDFLIFSLGILGLALAGVWFLVAHGSLLWIRKWREKVIEISKVVDPHQSYAEIETVVTKNQWWSPSNITQYLPLLFAAGWVLWLAAFMLH